MSITFRPLDEVTLMMSEIGFQVGYAYDDLVFSDNAVFIVQFASNTDKELKLYINSECEKPEAERISSSLKSIANKKGYRVISSGNFKLTQNAGSDQIDITFIPLPKMN